jgi:hypothetical protein
MGKGRTGEFFNTSFSNHSIEYSITNDDTHDYIFLKHIYYDPDDEKTFESFLVSFCKMATDNKVQYIKLFISDEEYKSNEHLFREFDVTNEEEGTYELISEPSKFVEAMLISYGCFDFEDKLDKKN